MCVCVCVCVCAEVQIFTKPWKPRLKCKMTWIIWSKFRNEDQQTLCTTLLNLVALHLCTPGYVDYGYVKSASRGTAQRMEGPQERHEENFMTAFRLQALHFLDQKKSHYAGLRHSCPWVNSVVRGGRVGGILCEGLNKAPALHNLMSERQKPAKSTQFLSTQWTLSKENTLDARQ
jgi:hypothetical protein